jgi:hAT family C-terminal dimerisation region
VTAQNSNLFRWHVDNQEDFPTISQMALDILFIPVISTEYERVFSSAKRLISDDRNRLQEDIIEVTEYLKGWWKGGLIR